MTHSTTAAQLDSIVITDPFILRYVMENEEINIEGLIKKAIRIYESKEAILPQPPPPTIQDELVTMSKTDLKSMYAEWCAFEKMRDEFMESSKCIKNFKLSRLERICNSLLLDTTPSYIPCPSCQFHAKNKKALSAHLRKCNKMGVVKGGDTSNEADENDDDKNTSTTT
jgi:hypothetical protein